MPSLPVGARYGAADDGQHLMLPRGILRLAVRYESVHWHSFPNRTARTYLFPIKCLSTEHHQLRGDPPQALVTERLFGAPACVRGARNAQQQQ